MANKTKNFTKRKGLRPNTKAKVLKEKDQESEIHHKYNDVSWYVKNEAMLRDAASLSFNNPLGGNLDPKKLWTNSDDTLNYSYSGKSVPGLMSLEFFPCIGKSESSVSPANLAAQNIYSYVRYMNSGSKNYDQADLMLYLLAMDSLYMFWNWAKRVYGYAMLYSQKNRYMPIAYAKVDGVNLEDIVANLSDYRLWLNSLAAQISSFCVPAVMPFFIRHSWMCSNIYADGEDAKAQQYMFVPGGFYRYDETGSEYGGKLELLVGPAAADDRDFITIKRLGKALIDAVAYSEDIGVMSGDILKAYGQERLFKLAPVDPDYQILPVYNEEVLTQIENSAIVTIDTARVDVPGAGFSKWSGMDISQDPDTGYLVWMPQLIPMAYQKVGTLINMHKDEVSPADVMVATRLTACQQGDEITAVGTEFIYRWKTVRLGSKGTLHERNWDAVLNLGSLGTTLGAETALGALPQLAEVTQFNRHPIVPVFCTVDSTSYFIGLFGDIANYTVVDAETLEQIHGTAIMSEFNIPQIGSF